MQHTSISERLLPFVRTFLSDFAIPLFIIFLVYQFVMCPFVVTGKSMDFTLEDQELILVNRLGTSLMRDIPPSKIERGDIVVFHPPVNEKSHYIKRVIGVAGDVVSFKDNEVYRNGVKLSEPYTKCVSGSLQNPEKSGKERCQYGNVEGMSFTVPEGAYFVMGDNRENSSDSRTCFTGRPCAVDTQDRFVYLDHMVGKKILNYEVTDAIGKYIGKIISFF